ncbi:MAG: response regulator receiver protein [Haloarculaceae archaeon]
MELPANSVVVFEENQTRADLYSLWLDEYDTETVVTKSGVENAIDERVAVAIIDQSFGDGAASTVTDVVRSRAPVCRIVATRERSEMFPDIDTEHQLVKPVFEEDLQDTVKTLLCRANYHLALGLYYHTTLDLSSFEFSDDENATSEEDYDVLRQRATRLQQLIAALTSEMTGADITAVKEAVTFESDPVGLNSEEKIDSKYQPSECSNCGQQWERAASESQNVTKLGAYVWGCRSCGHVQMRTDPSHQNVSPYRR